jgi:hypothetical protein
MNPTSNAKLIRDEDKNLYLVLEYIISTYSQHYVGEERNNIQLVDFWQSRGTLLTTALDTSMKYLTRFGKKKGYNRIDIYKAIHYALLALYASDNIPQDPPPPPDDSSDGILTESAVEDSQITLDPSVLLEELTRQGWFAPRGEE